MDRRIYPYLVPDDYPDPLSTARQQRRSIGHGLSLALVTPAGPPEAQIIGALGADELAAAGIDLATGYRRADESLSRALSQGEIALEFFERGPGDSPFVVVSGSWLAATTLVAPGLHERMARLLGEEILAAVPHRDRLFLFRPSAAAAMAPTVETEHRDAPKPLTTRMFQLRDYGPVPLSI